MKGVHLLATHGKRGQGRLSLASYKGLSHSAGQKELGFSSPAQ